MAIVQQEEGGGGKCHFTRQGLGPLLYLNSVMAKSLNSVQQLAPTLALISILARGAAKEADIL